LIFYYSKKIYFYARKYSPEELKSIVMRGVNRVILIGNLGKDPDIQYLDGNIPVAKFPIATTETYKDRTGRLISQTEWHSIVLWRGLADLAQKYLHKGSLIYVEGHLKNRSWEDKDGNKKFATEVVGDNLIMLDKRGESSISGSTKFDEDISHELSSDFPLPPSPNEP
jgi:single-strand DNA-binding protein